jgi:calcineurin-like phosphoesterase family protein
MNETLIKNWNAKVTPADKTYIIGDLIFGNDPREAENLIRRLNGHKVLIYGNHDKVCKKTNLMGLEYKTYYEEEDIYDGENWRKLVMFHYPILSWNKQRHGSWLAYGHCHGTMIDAMNKLAPGSWDVGVDTNGFAPISFEELAAKIKTTYPGGKLTNGTDNRYNKRK